MKVYSSFADAVNMEIVEPIAAGLDADEDARDLFDVDAIADELIEWHTEYVERGGELVEWLPGNGYRLTLGSDPDDEAHWGDDRSGEFWAVVERHRRVES